MLVCVGAGLSLYDLGHQPRAQTNATVSAPIVTAHDSASISDNKQSKLVNSGDPSKCSRDPQGMVYFAVGHRVFRQPASGLISTRDTGIARYTNLYQAPVPADYPGCPDNPLRGQVFILSAVSRPPASGKITVPSARIVVSIANSCRDDMQEVMEQVYNETCRRYGSRVKETQGLFGCVNPARTSPVNGKIHAIAYQARPDFYQVPFGKPYTIFCDISTNDPSYLDCQVHYKMFDEVNISYGFNTRYFSVESAVAFDSELRRDIGESQVFGYPWRASNAHKTGEIDPCPK